MNYRETMTRLNTALNNIDLAYAVIAKKYGLTFNALMMVCMIDDSDDITQKQICEALHIPKSTVHSILIEFIKQGHIALTTGNNKKEKLIVFTETGKQYFKEVLETTQCFENRILISLGDEACSFLVETAERLSEIISKEVGE